MDTNRLHQFKVVAETGNLRKAAELLHISHAGLFKSLRALESELGLELTTRDGRGIKITREGWKVYREIMPLLEAERRLKDAAASQRHPALPLVRLATFEVFSTYLAPLLTRALGTDKEIVFRELIPGKIEQSLVENRADLGVSYMAVPHADLDHIEVNRIEMGIFTGPAADFDTRDFAGIPFIVPLDPIEGSPTKARGLDGWPEDIHRRRIAYRVDLMETALALARQGQGAVYLPEFVAGLHNRVARPEFQLKRIKGPAGLPNRFPIYLIKPRTMNEDKAVRRVASLLRSLR